MSFTKTEAVKKILLFYLKLGYKSACVAAIDAVFLVLAVYIAYALRFTLFIEKVHMANVLVTALLFPSLVVLSLAAGGSYRTLWPCASIEEYCRMLRWYAIGALAFLLAQFLLHMSLSRIVVAMLLLLGIAFLTLERAIWKLAYVTRKSGREEAKRAVIIGAGEAGTLLARDLMRNSCGITPVCFVDDNPALRGMSVASLKVAGTTGDLRKILVERGAELALIAMPSAPGEKIRQIISMLDGLGVQVRILPSLINIADGRVSVSSLRSVKLEDLLRREPVKLGSPDVATLVRGKTVLVTGAGGSIGSEVCRQALAAAPERLVALGHGEHSLYLLLESLGQAGLADRVKPVVADIADERTMTEVFRKYKPDVVFHAAAHKHVPLMEENPREALRVNAYGTYVLASLAGEYGAERMVMISTDKAVHPTSVMGATKRIAERLLFNVQKKYPGTSYMAVRFGNVLGSRGSVVPKFEQQIKKGGPVTVTHKDMKRYFMLIPEAVSLVLQAGTIGKGGELFVLDMGEPVNIAEMAETLIRLHGYEPYRDIRIEFTGIRPGEKLYEELFYDAAHVDSTTNKKIFLARPVPEKESLLPKVSKMLEAQDEDGTSIAELKMAILKLAEEM
jgi:FlaA1/EpsC-like NDP-sugar epimerase